MMEDPISSNYLKLSYPYKTKNLLGRTNTFALMYMQSEIKDSQYLSQGHEKHYVNVPIPWHKEENYLSC